MVVAQPILLEIVELLPGKKNEGGEMVFTTVKRVYVERSDVSEESREGFFGIQPGSEVNLKNFGVVKSLAFDRAPGEALSKVRCELICTEMERMKKTKGQLHWVAATSARPVRLRLFESLFTVENPSLLEDFEAFVDPKSIQFCEDAKIDKSVALEHGKTYQFERIGYFQLAEQLKSGEAPLFNRVVSLFQSKKTQEVKRL